MKELERQALRRKLEGPHSETIRGVSLLAALAKPLLPTELELAAGVNVIPFPRKVAAYE